MNALVHMYYIKMRVLYKQDLEIWEMFGGRFRMSREIHLEGRAHKQTNKQQQHLFL